jgi:alkanesulfonate monooxygenase SsuD/methylene tetrahydromethanopterin reductase-like flavin-dependent oxidoreductase (luciferase family)
MTDTRPVTFGLKTSPVHTTYDVIRRAWLQADEVPEIEDAWLWDHMLPLTGPRDGNIFEGWTLLSALAAQTRRLRLGLLVTSNRIRQPAVLAKMASTVDVISGGRLVLGIGVGGTHQPGPLPPGPAQHNGLAEYAAYGLTTVPPGEGIGRLAEAITIIRRMFTEDEFDFAGRYYNPVRHRQRAEAGAATGSAGAGRRLGDQAVAGRSRAGRHLECARAAARQHGVPARAQPGAGPALRRHRPGSGQHHPVGADPDHGR